MRKIGKKHTRIINSVSDAYLFGYCQKEEKRLTQHELFKKVDWVQGYHKKLMWEAYKSGLWESKR
ncbi:MAG: hypothetical protein GY838_17500 [bacterium]|nr:hypothetical protein [bacterium]